MKRAPWRRRVILWLIRKRLLRYPIIYDAPVYPAPRYGHGKPPHPQLYSLIDADRGVYRGYLERFTEYVPELKRIPRESQFRRPNEPAWTNGYFVGLDVVALYGFLCNKKPAHYVEVGSGASTQVARRAITDQDLDTEIISIDPHPRLDIDSLCDTVIRRSLETVDLSLFEKLGPNDVLFFDGSHRVFTNSDVVVGFLDIIPRLKPGVLVQFHDIYLPSDYPPDWVDLFYSEQYLLAAYLLGGHKEMDIVLPNAFVSSDPELSSIMAPLWQSPNMEGVERGGGSFWLIVRDVDPVGE